MGGGDLGQGKVEGEGRGGAAARPGAWGRKDVCVCGTWGVRLGGGSVWQAEGHTVCHWQAVVGAVRSHFTNTRFGTGHKAGGAPVSNARTLLPVGFVDELRKGCQAAVRWAVYGTELRTFRNNL
jgi:hypothetical protein